MYNRSNGLLSTFSYWNLRIYYFFVDLSFYFFIYLYLTESIENWGINDKFSVTEIYFLLRRRFFVFLLMFG